MRQPIMNSIRPVSWGAAHEEPIGPAQISGSAHDLRAWSDEPLSTTTP